MQKVVVKDVRREGDEVVIRQTVGGVTTEERRRIISAHQMIGGKLVEIPAPEIG